jgi:hypothetical protein
MKIYQTLGIVAVFGLAGCQSQTQVLDNESAAAQQVALNRGKFELSCPNATATVLSRNLLQPAVDAPRFAGVERAEYTIGVAGCGKKQTYISVCQVGSVSCVSVEGREGGGGGG